MKIETPDLTNIIDIEITPENAEQVNKRKICSIFLAGTIDNGKSRNWQQEVINKLSKFPLPNLTIYNPRRENWNSDYDDQELIKQIEWEQEKLKKATYIFMVLDDKSKSPISLLELGEFCSSGKIMVFCTPKFYRWMNVNMFCYDWNIPLITDIDSKSIADTILDEITIDKAEEVENEPIKEEQENFLKKIIHKINN